VPSDDNRTAIVHHVARRIAAKNHNRLKIRPQHAWFATLSVLAADSPRVLRWLVLFAKLSTRAACIRHSSFVPFTLSFSFFVVTQRDAHY
jgi:hypothetical protein